MLVRFCVSNNMDFALSNVRSLCNKLKELQLLVGKNRDFILCFAIHRDMAVWVNTQASNFPEQITTQRIYRKYGRLNDFTLRNSNNSPQLMTLPLSGEVSDCYIENLMGSWVG